jgi:hypothetical protein
LANFDLRKRGKMLGHRLRKRSFEVFEALDKAVLPLHDGPGGLDHDLTDPSVVEALLNPHRAATPSRRKFFR